MAGPSNSSDLGVSSFVWPPETFSWKTPHSSAAIANFLSREQGDRHKDIDKMADQILDIVEQFQNDMEEKEIILDKDSFSLLRDTDSYPMKVLGRESTQMLRPVIIDGCAVAYSYDQNFDFVFIGESKNLPFRPKSVLPVKSLLDMAIHLLLQGHKVTIYLPEYYRKPWIESASGEKLWKVDRLNEYREMCGLGLIDFIDSEMSPSIVAIPTKLKSIVKELGGCFFSHADILEKYESLFPKNKTKTKKGIDDLIDAAKRMKIYEDPAERMLSMYFFGPGKDLSIVPQISVYIGTNSYNHVNRKNYYDRLQEVLLYFYTENNGEPDEIVKLQEQLYLGDQIKMVLKLASIMELKMGNLRSVQALLRIAQKYEICSERIRPFVVYHKWI